MKKDKSLFVRSALFTLVDGKLLTRAEFEAASKAAVRALEEMKCSKHLRAAGGQTLAAAGR